MLFGCSKHNCQFIQEKNHISSNCISDVSLEDMQGYQGSRSPGAMRSAGSGRGQAGNRARFSADIEYLMRQQKVIPVTMVTTKVLCFLTPRMFAVITLKFTQKSLSIEKFVQILLMKL